MSDLEIEQTPDAERRPRDHELAPRPEPKIEPGQPPPGGVDAVPFGDGVDDATVQVPPEVPDLDPEHNPATEERLPEEMKQGEDTGTQATRGEDEVAPEEESPA